MLDKIKTFNSHFYEWRVDQLHYRQSFKNKIRYEKELPKVGKITTFCGEML